MDYELISAIDSCLNAVRQLEMTVRQDCAEMGECTRGQVLAAYLDAMEQAISQLRKVESQLQVFRDEQCLIP